MRSYTAEEHLRAKAWNTAYEAINWHRAWQNVVELAEVLYLVAQESPLDVVVEIGCAWGGTLYAWGALGAHRPDVYGVTMNDYADLGGGIHGATVLVGDSHERATLQRLKDQLGGRAVDVLFIDGDHSYDGCLADWRMYSPLVRPSGLVLFHDIRCAGVEAVSAVWEQVIKPEVAASGGHTTEVIAGAGKPLGFGIVRKSGDQ